MRGSYVCGSHVMWMGSGMSSKRFGFLREWSNNAGSWGGSGSFGNARCADWKITGERYASSMNTRRGKRAGPVRASGGGGLATPSLAATVARPPKIFSQALTRRVVQKENSGGSGPPTGHRPVALENLPRHRGRTGLESGQRPPVRCEVSKILTIPFYERKSSNQSSIEPQGGTLLDAGVGP